jgi:hypothetical protein
MTKSQQAIRDLTRAMTDRTGNLPPLPGIFPDYQAPIVCNQPEGRELTMARWGMPSPVFAWEHAKWWGAASSGSLGPHSEGGETMAKLVWRLKLITELEPGISLRRRWRASSATIWRFPKRSA